MEGAMYTFYELVSNWLLFKKDFVSSWTDWPESMAGFSRLCLYEEQF